MQRILASLLAILFGAGTTHAQRPVTSSSVEIPDRGGVSLTTSGGPSSPDVGYASIDSSANVTAGVAIVGFRQNGVLVTEAALPASSPVEAGRIYVELDGRFNTGIAIANPNYTSVTISFFFTGEDGADFGSGKTTIQDFGQLTRFLSESPFNISSPIHGTFTFTSSLPVYAIGLRGFMNERSEFLITVVPLTPLVQSDADVILPHFADGAGWRSHVVLVNPTDQMISGNVRFFSRTGEVGDSFAYTLLPRGARKFSTSGSGITARQGAVRISPGGGTGAPSVFEILSCERSGITVTETTFPAITSSAAFRLYVETAGDFDGMQPGAIQSGIAIANPEPILQTVNLELSDLLGASVASAALTVPAFGQLALSLNHIEGLQSVPRTFKGVLRMSTGSPSTISLMGWRARYNERSDLLLTAIPPASEVVAGRQGVQMFPHIADGGGYSTQIVLYNQTATTSSQTRIDYFRSGINWDGTPHKWGLSLVGEGAPTIGDILNTASMSSQTLNASSSNFPELAPGSLISLLGTSLTDGAVAYAPGVSDDGITSSGRDVLPTTLAGIRVLVDGVPAPLFFVSAERINAQVPVESKVFGIVAVRVERPTIAGQLSPAMRVAMTEAAPGILTISRGGSGPAVVVPAKPALWGQAITITATGLGQVNGPARSGQPATSAFHTRYKPEVLIGGVRSPLLFSGLAMGTVGLYHVTVVVPQGMAGDNVEVQLRSVIVNSNTATIATVKRPRVVPKGGGPYGGTVKSIAIAYPGSGAIYAGTSGGGVFRSANGGKIWEAINGGLTDGEVEVLAVDPKNPQTIYAGTDGSGILKTIDGGETWNPASSGLAARNITALATDPANSNLVYAQTRDGLYKSTDGGQTWLLREICRKPCEQLSSNRWIDPENRPVVIASPTGTIYATSEGGLFKSADGAETWTLVPISIGSDWLVSSVRLVIEDPLNPAVLYVGGTGGYIVKSTDAGKTWTGLNFFYCSALAVDPFNPNHLLVGTESGEIHASDNGGLTWKRADSGLRSFNIKGGVRTLVIDREKPNTAYVGMGVGIFITVDGGKSWTSANEGISATDVQSVAVDPSNPGNGLAGMSNTGVFKTFNGGGNWLMVDNMQSVSSVVFNPRDSRTVYAAGQALLRSTDGGNIWSRIDPNADTPLNYLTKSVVVDPRNPLVLYSAPSYVSWWRISKTSDGGLTWKDLEVPNRPVIQTIAIDPQNTDTIYAATETGLFKSVNGGTSFVLANTGLPTQPILTMAIDPRTPSTIYAGTVQGIFKTVNGGENWAASGLPTETILVMMADPNNPLRLYAGTEYGGVFASSNGGRTWIGMGQPTAAIQGLAIDPSNSGVLFAATRGSGVLRSMDAGATWAPVTTSPEDLAISVKASPDPVRSGEQLTLTITIHNLGDHPAENVTLKHPLPRFVSFLSCSVPIGTCSESDGIITAILGTLAAGQQSVITVTLAAPLVYAYSSVSGAVNVSTANTDFNVPFNRAAFDFMTVGLTGAQPGGGPPGTSINVIAVDRKNSANIFAGSDDGTLFKSVDVGLSWTAVRFGSSPVRAIAISPVDSSTILVAISGAIFRSTDGGQNWTRPSTFGNSTTTIVFDPADPLTVYAGGWNYLLISKDGGFSWTYSGSREITSLAVAPGNPSIIHIGFPILPRQNDNRAYFLQRSNDGGRTWQNEYTGLPDAKISALVVDPANTSVLYAGVSSNGVFKTIDGGVTWTAVNDFILAASSIQAIAIDPVDSRTLYAGSLEAGAFKSIDGGSTWSRLDLPIRNVQSIAIASSDPSIVYAGTNAGVFKSTDGGRTWAGMNAGLNAWRIGALAVEPGSGIVHVGTNSGNVFQSSDGGSSWTRTFSDHTVSDVTSILVTRQTTAQSTSQLYVATAGGGIFTSRDRATTWSPINSGLSDLEVFALIVDPVDSCVLYAGTKSGVFKSLNCGQNWSETGLRRPLGALPDYRTVFFAFDPADSHILYAGGLYGLWRTTDGGLKWTESLVAASVTSLVIDLRGTLYAGIANWAITSDPPASGPLRGFLGSAVVKSVDRGQTWSRLFAQSNEWIEHQLTIDPRNQDTIYATYNGVLKSSNGGQNWVSMNSGLHVPDSSILVIDPNNARTLYLATRGSGIFKSVDSGRSWLPIGR